MRVIRRQIMMTMGIYIDRFLHLIKNITSNCSVVFSLVVLGADGEGALFARERVIKRKRGSASLRLRIP
jgi:hypothetical protein